MVANAHQNDIIDPDNDSNQLHDVHINNVSQFYNGARVFITGATGFVGKSLLEKLLRSCTTIDRIYLLIRPKKGLPVDQRLTQLLANPVFDRVRDKDALCFAKVKAVSGDVSLPNLGLSNPDQAILINDITIAFHSAATVRFTEDLRDAVVLNTRGTKRVVEFCKQMRHLKSFVHVSTAYSNADKREIAETVYEPAYNPEAIINCIDILPPDVVRMIANTLMDKHPNSYTLTKALAEFIVHEYFGVFPAAIVRPSIVTASWREPFPGWVDNISGITGIMMECSRGTIKSIMCNESFLMDIIPVDIVANTLIAAAWHTAAYRSNTMRIYNCVSGQINGITWRRFGELTQKYAIEYPSKYVSLYPGFTYTTSRLLHWFYHVVLHVMPACAFDIFLYCTRHKPIMMRICRKIARAAKNGEFFALNEWTFQTATMQQLRAAVRRAEDGATFDIDIRTANGFDWDAYVKTYLLGIRQHVLKDDWATLPNARVKLNRLYWAKKVVQGMAIYTCLRLMLSPLT